MKDDYGNEIGGPDVTAAGPSLVDSVLAWTLAKAGQAIDVEIDRNRTVGQTINDPSRAYGVGPDGRIYQVGQPSATAVQPQLIAGIPNVALLLGAALLAFVLYQSD